MLAPLALTPPANSNASPSPLPFEVGRDLTDPRIVVLRVPRGSTRGLRGATRDLPDGIMLIGGDEPATALVNVDGRGFAALIRAYAAPCMSIRQTKPAAKSAGGPPGHTLLSGPHVDVLTLC